MTSRTRVSYFLCLNSYLNMLNLYVESKFSYCVRFQSKTSQSIALRCINLMRILVPETNASFVFKFLISKTCN
jgi:hypothetical protein